MDFKLNTKVAKDIRLSFGKPVLFILPVIALLFVPAVTHAGFFSWLTGQDVLAETQTVISSSSADDNESLKPVNNSNPVPKENPPLVIEDNSLLAGSIPSNVSLDIVDSSSGQISTYTVHKGDTFAGIAKMFGVSINTILWANDLTKSSPLKAV